MCMVWPCHSLVDGLSSKCINLYKKVKLINPDCLPILMLLYIMLAYLMLLAALSNAACFHNVFFAIDFCKCFLFSCFALVYWHMVCLFQVWPSIMPSVLNLLVLPNSMFTPFFTWKGYCSLEKLHLKMTIIIIIMFRNIWTHTSESKKLTKNHRWFDVMIHCIWICLYMDMPIYGYAYIWICIFLHIRLTG